MHTWRTVYIDNCAIDYFAKIAISGGPGAWIILCMCTASERWYYSVTSSLIGWVQA